MRHEPLSERARGQWAGILAAIGVPSKALRNKHGPCPICGGRDRFRFDDKGGRGTWYCNQCGAGDGIELTKRFLGVEFKEAAKAIEQHIGAVPVRGPDGNAGSDDRRQRAAMRALWSRSQAITPDDPAGLYLTSRMGISRYPDALRFAPDERYAEAGTKPSWHPVMVAKVDPSDEAATRGERAAIHRTYLNEFGEKAAVTTPRKMMGAMPTGAAVRLGLPKNGTIGIAEGIETALSASILFDLPVWAALTAGLLQEWAPPADVDTVFVFGDNDASNTGQAAAYGLAQRLKAKGLTVIVELPTSTGQDWNDVLRLGQRSR